MKHMSIKSSVFNNTLAQITGRGISALLTLLVTIILARTFGVELYGNLIKVVSYVLLFDLAVDFGLNAIIVRKLQKTENPNDPIESSILSQLFTTRIVLGSILTAVVALSTIVLPHAQTLESNGFSTTVKLSIVLLSPTILFSAIIKSCNAYFQYKLTFDRSTITTAIGGLVSFLIILILVITKTESLLFLTSAYLIATLTQSYVAYYLFVNLKSKFVSIKPEINSVLPLLRQTFPLGLALIFNIAFFRVDTLILTYFRSTTEVGLYGLAYKFFELPLTLPHFFMNAVFPILAGYKLTKTKSSFIFFRLVFKSGYLLFFSSIMLSTLLWIVAPLIQLIKSDFIGSIALFRILVLWLPLFFISSLFMWAIIARGARWSLVWIYGAGLVVNLSLNIKYIPIYGATAAAYTTGLTEMIILSLLFIYFIYQNNNR